MKTSTLLLLVLIAGPAAAQPSPKAPAPGSVYPPPASLPKDKLGAAVEYARSSKGFPAVPEKITPNIVANIDSFAGHVEQMRRELDNAAIVLTALQSDDIKGKIGEDERQQLIKKMTDDFTNRNATLDKMQTAFLDMHFPKPAAAPKYTGPSIGLPSRPTRPHYVPRSAAGIIVEKGFPGGPGKRILSEDNARRVTQFLADPLARLPSFPRMGASELPFAAAVKTGTSVGYRDAWTVAWTPKYLVAVWVGHPDWRPMRELGGYRSAAEIAQDVLLLLHEDQTNGMTDLAFPPPRGSHPVRLCAHTGRIAGTTCEQLVTEWFLDGEGPTRTCDSHLRVGIDRRNGLLATGRTPPEHLETRTFLELGSRYAAWAATAGIPSAPEETSPLDARTPSETWTATAGGPLRTAEKPVTLRISSPSNGVVILRDPEMPSAMSTLPLEAGTSTGNLSPSSATRSAPAGS